MIIYNNIKKYRNIIILLSIIIILSSIIYFIVVYNKINDITYLFWTGGYDSTFRLCQLLINEKKKVLPIYISWKDLDNSPNKYYKRNNHKQEIKAISNIRKEIIKKFPEVKNNFMKTKIINNINISNYIKTHMYNLWKRKLNHRPMSQYGGLAQVTINLNKNIEIAVEKSNSSTMRRIVNKYIIKNNNNNNIIKTNDKDINIFNKMLFPTINITKKDMLNISKKYNYDNILYLTWSCWFPKNNKKCNNCPMCKQRII